MLYLFVCSPPLFSPPAVPLIFLSLTASCYLFPYGSDDDCGGAKCIVATSGNTAPGDCICDCKGCLGRIMDSIGGSKDIGCAITCDCGQACSSYNTTDPDATDYNTDGATCSGTCTACDPNSPTTCSDDQDCVNSYCVESAICTRDKEKLCDRAWKAVSGKNDNSAKCCPATSGCIKSKIGVTKTSTCSTNCGSCLTSKQGDKQGSITYQIPSTFCRFGSKLGKS